MFLKMIKLQDGTLTLLLISSSRHVFFSLNAVFNCECECLALALSSQ